MADKHEIIKEELGHAPGVFGSLVESNEAVRDAANRRRAAGG